MVGGLGARRRGGQLHQVTRQLKLSLLRAPSSILTGCSRSTGEWALSGKVHIVCTPPARQYVAPMLSQAPTVPPGDRCRGQVRHWEAMTATCDSFGNAHASSAPFEVRAILSLNPLADVPIDPNRRPSPPRIFSRGQAPAFIVHHSLIHRRLQLIRLPQPPTTTPPPHRPGHSDTTAQDAIRRP